MKHIEAGIKERYSHGVLLEQGYQYCFTCNKCNTNEYWYSDKEGRYLSSCKECIQKEIGYDIIKAIPYLDIFNLPYIPEQWDRLVKKAKESGISCPFGRYLSYCKLKGFEVLGFTDILIYHNYNINEKEYKNFCHELIKYINNKFDKQLKIY